MDSGGGEIIKLLQLKVPPVGEYEGCQLEHDVEEKEADEGQEEEGSLPVNSTAAQEREADLDDGKAEHQECEVEPASLLVKNTVVVLKIFLQHFHFQIVFNILRCSE